MQLAIENFSPTFNSVTADVIEIYLFDPIAVTLPDEAAMAPVFTIVAPPYADPGPYEIDIPWTSGATSGDKIQFFAATNIDGAGPTNISGHTQTSTKCVCRLRDDGSGGYSWQFVG